MTYSEQIRTWLHQLRLAPLHCISLSRSKRWLLVAVSYGLGAIGLWLFFPPTHNGDTMLLPLACACWLFRYQGLLISIVLNGIVFQCAYFLILRGLLPDSAFAEGGIIGLSTSLLIGLIICFLREAVDAVQLARQQAQVSDHSRMLTELRERQASLAYEQERKINALKEQFLLNMSHELRTPLTSLAGFLDILDMYQEQLDPQMRTHMIKKAQASQQELTILIDHVLDTARTVGEIPIAKPEAVNVYDLIQKLLMNLAHGGLAAYRLQLRVSKQVIVWADPQFVRQVLRNLLTNICKYVPAQTEICIEATQADPSSPVCLSIQDAGPGIPADELPLLFEKFVRLKRDIASSTRGTGLGLYLCKQFVEAMGGHIWVESTGKQGEGSCFYLILPTPSPSQVSEDAKVPLTASKQGVGL